MSQNQHHQNPAQNSVKKEIMVIEKIDNTETASKSPPKKDNPDVKAKSKGASFASQKKMKKNTPNKSSGGLELNQPTKITLMTNFLNSISKNTYVPCHEKSPDHNVIDGCGDMLIEVLVTERLTYPIYIYIWVGFF